MAARKKKTKAKTKVEEQSRAREMIEKVDHGREGGTTSVDGELLVGEPVVFEHEPAKVNVSLTSTTNTGDYQSVKVGVSLSVPCTPDRVDEAFAFAKEWAKDRVSVIEEELGL